MSSYKELYTRLCESDFNCVSVGFHETAEIYDLVEDRYPSLCDESILCEDICTSGDSQPEWKHRLRTAQQRQKSDPESRVKHLSKGWFYGPRSVDVSPPDLPFEVGRKYNRWELHDRFGGQRYGGISTPTDHPLVFIFSGESGEAYGYADEFLPDDTFLYTGEGTEGDMEMEGGNKAIYQQRERGEELHLFEDTEYPWIVTYVGEFEYVDHQWDTLPDSHDQKREAIRFRLQPVGGTDIEIEEGSPETLSNQDLFDKAKQSRPTNTSTGSTPPSSQRRDRSYKRSEVVKQFALKDANGMCQGCNEDAPFLDENNEPFLEVHHLYRRSDGGPDDPENVLALCPNCHRRVHHGKDGDEFNQHLIQIAERRNEQYREQR